MADTRNGPFGLSAVGLVAQESNIVLVPAQILGQHTEDECVADWDQLRRQRHVMQMGTTVNDNLYHLKRK